MAGPTSNRWRSLFLLLRPPLHVPLAPGILIIVKQHVRRQIELFFSPLAARNASAPPPPSLCAPEPLLLGRGIAARGVPPPGTDRPACSKMNSFNDNIERGGKGGLLSAHLLSMATLKSELACPGFALSAASSSSSASASALPRTAEWPASASAAAATASCATSTPSSALE